MGASINQYIETLENPHGRFRTLEDIFPLRNEDGGIRLRTHRRYVDFDVRVKSRDAVLRAPLGLSSSLSEMRILCSRLRRMHSEHMVAFDYMESEMTVFDVDSKARRIDVCLQILPEHVGFEQFLDLHSASGDRAALEHMTLRLVELLAWAHRNSLGAVPSSLIVAQSEKGYVPRMVSVSKVDCSSQIIVAALMAAVSPQRYHDCARRILLQPSVFGLVAGQLTQRFRGTSYDFLAGLTEGCDGCTFANVLSRLAAFSHLDFCNLEQLLAVQPRILPDMRTADMAGHAENLLSRFYWTDDCSRDIVCAMDNEGWKYVDSNGRKLIEETFRYAEPFREGRAEVETDAGKGLIDESGRYVMPPQYEEMCWDDYYGVAVAMKYGKWTLHNRQGESLTGQPFDYLGICSEGLVVARRGGKWGYINTAGQVAIPLKYDDATSFSDGRAQVTLLDDTFVIDMSGRKVEG